MSGPRSHTSPAVLLKTYPLGESDRLVVGYTRDYGKLRGVLRGATRNRQPKGGGLQPFVLAELDFHESSSSDLVRIERVELLDPLATRVHDYDGYLQLSYVAEVILETTVERDPCAPLYRLLLQVLPEFRAATRRPLARMYFDSWYLKLAGLFPSIHECAGCRQRFGPGKQRFWSHGDTRIFCADCRFTPFRTLTGENVQLLGGIFRKPLSELWQQWAVWAEDCELAAWLEHQVVKGFDRQFDSLKLMK